MCLCHLWQQRGWQCPRPQNIQFELGAKLRPHGRAIAINCKPAFPLEGKDAHCTVVWRERGFTRDDTHFFVGFRGDWMESKWNGSRQIMESHEMVVKYITNVLKLGKNNTSIHLMTHLYTSVTPIHKTL